MFFALHFFIRKLNQTLFVLLPISPLGRRTRRCWANTIKKRLLYGHFDASIPSKLAISSFYLHTQVFSRTIERRSGARKRRVRCVKLLLPSLYVVPQLLSLPRETQEENLSDFFLSSFTPKRNQCQTPKLWAGQQKHRTKKQLILFLSLDVSICQR